MSPSRSDISTQISVIVPIFNTEMYLEECVRSILNQTFPDFELILINDGSTDGSGMLCENLAGKDSRIQLISYDTRKGVSYARNRGMEIATGKYLFFMDSDDMIHPQLLENMYLQAEMAHADLVMTMLLHGKMISLNEWYSFCKCPYVTRWETLSGAEVLNHWFHLKEKNSIGGELFLREALHMLRFDEDVNYSEDLLFNYSFLSGESRTISMADNYGYYYRYRDDSVCRTVLFTDYMRSLQIIERIRDTEWLAGRKSNSIVAEQDYVGLIRTMFSDRKIKSDENRTIIRSLYKEENRQPLIRKLSVSQRVLLFLCINMHPLYKFLKAAQRYFQKHAMKLYYFRHFGQKESG